MSTEMAIRDDARLLEQVLVGGDLKCLTPAQRVSYYTQVCESVGLNPLTKPFEYIYLSGKLTLYAKRDAADQLRKRHGVSIEKPEIEFAEGLVVVTVTARDSNGRTDSELGAVAIDGLKGEARANAIMKAITKAKRRVTLSLCGLGWLDESEIDSIPDAQRVTVDAETGEIAGEPKPAIPAERTPEDKAERNALRLELAAHLQQLGLEDKAATAWIQHHYGVGNTSRMTTEQLRDAVAQAVAELDADAEAGAQEVA